MSWCTCQGKRCKSVSIRTTDTAGLPDNIWLSPLKKSFSTHLFVSIVDKEERFVFFSSFLLFIYLFFPHFLSNFPVDWKELFLLTLLCTDGTHKTADDLGNSIQTPISRQQTNIAEFHRQKHFIDVVKNILSTSIRSTVNGLRSYNMLVRLSPTLHTHTELGILSIQITPSVGIYHLFLAVTTERVGLLREILYHL